MNKAILLIGGNEGDRIENINNAIIKLQNQLGNIIKISDNYESEPWGFEHSCNFINAVLVVETKLNANQILTIGKKIEKELGRKPKVSEHYEGRTMDIDILFFNNEIINTNELTVPHPYLHKRRFTLLPLVEIMPEYVHPLLNKNMKQLLNDCNDVGECYKVESYVNI